MTTWQRDPRTLWRRSGDRIVVAPSGTDSVLLEGTAGITWRLLEEPMEHTELLALLGGLFEADPDTIETEVEAFLVQLVDIGAVARC